MHTTSSPLRPTPRRRRPLSPPLPVTAAATSPPSSPSTCCCYCAPSHSSIVSSHYHHHLRRHRHCSSLSTSMRWLSLSSASSLCLILILSFFHSAFATIITTTSTTKTTKTNIFGHDRDNANLPHTVSRYLDNGGHHRYRQVLGLKPGVYYNPLHFYSRAHATYTDRSTITTQHRKRPPSLTSDRRLLRLLGVHIPGIDPLSSLLNNNNPPITTITTSTTSNSLKQTEGDQSSTPTSNSGNRRCSLDDYMVANGTQSNFVTYFTNNTPDTVRRVMRRMCQIWADRFVSRVEMRICLKWEELDEGTLGATSTLVFIDGSRYSRLKNKVLYTPALGSALHGSDLIDPGGHHVIMVLNNLILWHLDLDETSRLDRFDLATTILHELTHGLFFTGAIQYTPTSTSTTSPSSSNTESSENSSSGQSASFRFGNAARFDQFIRVEGNISVAKSCNGDNIPKNGENLYNAIRSPNLQLVGRLRNRVFEMGLHAPRVYARGSSVYHFNNETIEEDCDRSGIPSGACSDLMTHELKQGYTNRDLGQTTLGVYDLMRSQQDGVKAGAPCVVQDYQPDDSGPGGSGEPGTFDLSTWGIIIISVVGAVGVILVVSVVVNTIVSRR